MDRKTHLIQALGWTAGLRQLNCHLTVVKLNGPKRLTGPIQNGVWLVVLLLGQHTQTSTPPADRQNPRNSCYLCGTR